LVFLLQQKGGSTMKKLWLVLAAIVSLGLVQTAVAGPREDAFLKELQAKLSEKGSPWIAGHTSVSHLSFEEKKKLLTMPLVSELPYYPERRRLSKTPKDKPPATMDWRNHDGHNWMTAVHQQLWGDCWAFNWIAAQEARMKIFRNEPNEMYNLSEQFVVSCNPYGFGNGGTNYIGNWVMQDGVPDEACFPYRGSGQACTQRCSDWQARVEQIGGRIIDWGDTPLSTTAVQNEVMNGPTALAVNWKEGKNEGIREDFFYYKGGVYEPVMGEWIKSGHALCLCGWNSSGNWLVKNSWGTGWGAGGTNNGYGYVSKELWNNVWMVPQSLYVVRLLMEDMVLGPGNWQPGGQTNITVTLNSTGIDAANVQGTISFTDPYVSIDVDHSTFGNIPSQTQGTNTSNPFKVTASASCPLGHVVSVSDSCRASRWIHSLLSQY
jgi:C1A family cysteine protease